MPENDDALKRRLQGYFADLEGEPIPPGIERLHMTADLPPPTWRERFLIPAISAGVAIVVLLVVVLVFAPGRRNQDLDVGVSTPIPTPPPSTTSTTARSTTTAVPPTLATAPSTVTSVPPTTTPTTTPNTTPNTSASTTIPSGQLFADDFSGAQVGSVPLGWTVDSGTWAVVQSGNGKALQGSTPKGQEGRISNGSAWTNVTVSASVRREAQNTVAGVAARYQSASNYYFCKIDGGQVAVGKFIGDKGSILSSTKVTIPQSQVVTLAFTVKGNALQCTVNGGNLVSATDSALTSGRMALAQDGPATFGTVVVTSV